MKKCFMYFVYFTVAILKIILFIYLILIGLDTIKHNLKVFKISIIYDYMCNVYLAKTIISFILLCSIIENTYNWTLNV